MTTNNPEISEYLFSQNPSLTGFCGFLKKLGRSHAKKPLCAFCCDLWAATVNRIGTGEEAVRETFTSLKLSKTNLNRVAKRLTVCSACASLAATELTGWERPGEEALLEHLERVKHSVIQDDNGSVGQVIQSMAAVLQFFNDLTPEEARLVWIAERFTGEKSGSLVDPQTQDPAGKLQSIQLTDRDINVMYILGDRVKDEDQCFMKVFLEQIPPENLNGITRTLRIGLRITDVLFTKAGGGRILTKKEHFTKNDWRQIQKKIEILKNLESALRLRLLVMHVMNRITDKSLTDTAAQRLSAGYCKVILKALEKVCDHNELQETVEAFEAFRVLPLIFRHLSPMQSFAAVSVVRPENDDFVNMALNTLNGVGLSIAQRTESQPAAA